MAYSTHERLHVPIYYQNVIFMCWSYVDVFLVTSRMMTSYKRNVTSSSNKMALIRTHNMSISSHIK